MVLIWSMLSSHMACCERVFEACQGYEKCSEEMWCYQSQTGEEEGTQGVAWAEI